jgi:hypothetical protein
MLTGVYVWEQGLNIDGHRYLEEERLNRRWAMARENVAELQLLEDLESDCDCDCTALGCC